MNTKTLGALALAGVTSIGGAAYLLNDEEGNPIPHNNCKVFSEGTFLTYDPSIQSSMGNWYMYCKPDTGELCFKRNNVLVGCMMPTEEEMTPPTVVEPPVVP